MIYFFVSLITFYTYQIYKNRNKLILIEKKDYNPKKCKKELLKNFINLELLGFFLIIIAFIYNLKTAGICTIVLYTFLSLIELNKSEGKFKLKKSNLKIIIPVLISYLIVFTIIIIDYLNLQKQIFMIDHYSYYYLIVIIFGYFNNLILFLSLLINNLLKNKLK